MCSEQNVQLEKKDGRETTSSQAPDDEVLFTAVLIGRHAATPRTEQKTRHTSYNKFPKRSGESKTVVGDSSIHHGDHRAPISRNFRERE